MTISAREIAFSGVNNLKRGQQAVAVTHRAAATHTAAVTLAGGGGGGVGGDEACWTAVENLSFCCLVFIPVTCRRRYKRSVLQPLNDWAFHHVCGGNSSIHYPCSHQRKQSDPATATAIIYQPPPAFLSPFFFSLSLFASRFLFLPPRHCSLVLCRSTGAALKWNTELMFFNVGVTKPLLTVCKELKSKQRSLNKWLPSSRGTCSVTAPCCTCNMFPTASVITRGSGWWWGI